MPATVIDGKALAAATKAEAAEKVKALKSRGINPVSYTHLTLPTKLEV